MSAACTSLSELSPMCSPVSREPSLFASGTPALSPGPATGSVGHMAYQEGVNPNFHILFGASKFFFLFIKD